MTSVTGIPLRTCRGIYTLSPPRWTVPGFLGSFGGRISPSSLSLLSQHCPVTFQTYSSVLKTGHLPSGSFSCFPRSVQFRSAWPPRGPRQLARILLQSLSSSQEGGRQRQTRPVTLEAPSLPCQAQTSRADWVHPGCQVSLEKYQQCICTPPPKTPAPGGFYLEWPCRFLVIPLGSGDGPCLQEAGTP